MEQRKQRTFILKYACTPVQTETTFRFAFNLLEISDIHLIQSFRQGVANSNLLVHYH